MAATTSSVWASVSGKRPAGRRGPGHSGQRPGPHRQVTGRQQVNRAPWAERLDQLALDPQGTADIGPRGAGHPDADEKPAADMIWACAPHIREAASAAVMLADVPAEAAPRACRPSQAPTRPGRTGSSRARGGHPRSMRLDLVRTRPVRVGDAVRSSGGWRAFRTARTESVVLPRIASRMIARMIRSTRPLLPGVR